MSSIVLNSGEPPVWKEDGSSGAEIHEAETGIRIPPDPGHAYVFPFPDQWIIQFFRDANHLSPVKAVAGRKEKVTFIYRIFIAVGSVDGIILHRFGIQLPDSSFICPGRIS